MWNGLSGLHFERIAVGDHADAPATYGLVDYGDHEEPMSCPDFFHFMNKETALALCAQMMARLGVEQ